VLFAAAMACTSDNGSPTAASSTTQSTTSTTAAPTTTAPPAAIPFPEDVSQVEVGKVYEYFLTAHCGFSSLNEEIDGSYWYAPREDRLVNPFAKAMAALDEREAMERNGVTGELHYVDENTMVLTAPATGESLTFRPTQQVWGCY